MGGISEMKRAQIVVPLVLMAALSAPVGCSSFQEQSVPLLRGEVAALEAQFGDLRKAISERPDEVRAALEASLGAYVRRVELVEAKTAETARTAGDANAKATEADAGLGQIRAVLTPAALEILQRQGPTVAGQIASNPTVLGLLTALLGLGGSVVAVSVNRSRLGGRKAA